MSKIEYTKDDSYPKVFVFTKNKVAIDVTSFSHELIVHSDKDDVSTEIFRVAGTVVDGTTNKVQFKPAKSDNGAIITAYYSLVFTRSSDSYQKTVMRDKYNVK